MGQLIIAMLVNGKMFCSIIISQSVIQILVIRCGCDVKSILIMVEFKLVQEIYETRIVFDGWVCFLLFFFCFFTNINTLSFFAVDQILDCTITLPKNYN